ncbi:MAG: hypothetical protein Q4A28_05200 [Brachymonas sp.]|nr:hypothetical protein [Brachymonas sp.]
MRKISSCLALVALGLLTACAGRGGVQSHRYHDQMSRQQFVAQCAADSKSGRSGLSHAQLRSICACSYDGGMRTYGSAAGLARAHRSDRTAYRKTLARIAQSCARKTLNRR